jgi:hypothetical protein
MPYEEGEEARRKSIMMDERRKPTFQPAIILERIKKAGEV